MRDRLISADALKSSILQWQFKIGQDGTWYVLGLIDSTPAVEAEPVKHGHWIVLHGVLAGDGIYGDMGECSNCGLHLRNWEWDYCPSCGARMDEVEE